MSQPLIKRIETGYAPRQLQDYVHSRLERFNVLVFHRRWGKTVLAVNEIIDQAMRCNWYNPQYAYVAPTYGQAERIAWDYVKQYTRNIPGVEYNSTKLTCTIPRPHKGDRIKIMLLGAENPDSLRGIYLDGCVLDEFGAMSPSIWGLVVRPALADRKGWCVFLGTPSGTTNHFYDMYNLGLRNQGKGWFAVKFRASQTGIIPKEEMAAMKLEMSEEQWNQEMECDFHAANIGSYWGKLITKLETAAPSRITKVPHDPALLVNTYWDLGISDTTTIWFEQQFGLETRLIDYLEMSGEGLEYYAKALKAGHRGAYDYGEHFWPHDGAARDLSTGKERVVTMRSLLNKHVSVQPKYDVADSIDAVRKLLPKCVFDGEKCVRGLEALRAYQRRWDEKNMVFQDKPLHDWASHGSDAFRLLAMSKRSEITARSSHLPRSSNLDYDIFNYQSNGGPRHVRR